MPPAYALLKITGHNHDFGMYYEVECFYTDDDKESVDYAIKLETRTPELWDDEAKGAMTEEYKAAISAGRVRRG
jgi:hypothetical protein